MQNYPTRNKDKLKEGLVAKGTAQVLPAAIQGIHAIAATVATLTPQHVSTPYIIGIVPDYFGSYH